MRLSCVLFTLLCACAASIVDARPIPSDSQARLNAVVLERFAADRVLVKFKPGTAAAEIAKAHSGASAMPLEEIPGIGVQVVRVAAGSVLAKVAAYQANPNVLYAEPDYYRLLVVPNEEPGPTPVNGANYFEEQWYLNNTGQRHTIKQYNILGQLTFKSTTGTADADIDAPEAWDISQGVVTTDPAAYDTAKVAVLDSGADCAALELSGKCLEQVNFVAGQSVIGDSCPPSAPACDNLGHGTFTASEIVANTDNGEGIAGAAWHTSAGIFKVCYREWVTDGFNLFEVGLCPVSASATAIAEAASNRLAGGSLVRSQYHVISMSYGSDSIDESGNITPTDPSNSECDAVQFAVDNGVVMVAGAGNNGDTQRFYPAACTDGNDESTVIAVAASDHHDYRASFSTYSQINDPWVSLSAPGENIIGILPDAQCGLASGVDSCVDWWDGTSMATPLVAGGAALVWADLYATLQADGAAGEALAPANCTWAGLSCNQIVRQRLENGADKIGAQGQNMQEWTRHGRLNIAGALALGGVEPPPLTLEAPVLVSVGVLTESSGNQTVYLSWSHDDTDLTGFDIERNTLHKSGRITSTLVIPLTDGTLRAYTDDAPSGRYSYRIRARNEQQLSSWSGYSTVMTVSDGGGGGGGKGGGGKPNK